MATTSKEDIQKILDHILKDSAFRTKLLADPAGALGDIGVPANDEITTALQGLDEASLESLARSFGTDSAA
jgi:hypothetical protein